MKRTRVEVRMSPGWERAVGEAAMPGLLEFANERTRQYDQLIAKHRGGNAEVVKRELRRITLASGGDLTESDLTEHAEAIVAGKRIIFRT